MSQSVAAFVSVQDNGAASRQNMGPSESNTRRTRCSMLPGRAPPTNIVLFRRCLAEAGAGGETRHGRSRRNIGSTSSSAPRRTRRGMAARDMGSRGGRITSSGCCRSHQRRRAWADRFGRTSPQRWVSRWRKHRVIARHPTRLVLLIPLEPTARKTYRLKDLDRVPLAPITMQQMCAD
jgi:hypothetical protein